MVVIGSALSQNVWRVDTVYNSVLYYPLVDPEGFVYGVTETGTVVQIDSSGRLLNRFASEGLGRVGYLAWHMPYSRLMIFYPETQVLIFLDRHLAELYRINLREMGFVRVTAVAAGTGRTLWLYDAGQHRLVHYNYALRRILRSASIPMQLGFYPMFTQLIVVGQLIFAVDTSRNAIFAFDYYGFLKHRLNTDVRLVRSADGHILIVHTPADFELFDVQNQLVDFMRRIRYPYDNCVAYGTYWSEKRRIFSCRGITVVWTYAGE